MNPNLTCNRKSETKKITLYDPKNVNVEYDGPDVVLFTHMKNSSQMV